MPTRFLSYIMWDHSGQFWAKTVENPLHSVSKNIYFEKKSKTVSETFFGFKEIKTPRRDKSIFPAFYKQKAQLYTINGDQARCHILFVSGNSAPHYFSSTSRGSLEVDSIWRFLPKFLNFLFLTLKNCFRPLMTVTLGTPVKTVFLAVNGGGAITRRAKTWKQNGSKFKSKVITVNILCFADKNVQSSTNVLSTLDKKHLVASTFHLWIHCSIFWDPLSPKTMSEYCRTVAGIEINIVLAVGRERLGQCSFFFNTVVCQHFCQRM